jgi:hypothetical protein
MRDRLGRATPTVWLLLAGAMAASAVLILHWGSRLTFLLDDWEFLVFRRGFTADSILSPHGEHIAVAPVLIYKALLATAGMSSSLPFLAVSLVLFLTTAALLFVYLQRRVDPWLALLGAAIVLFLGPAFDDLLWDFQMGFNGSLACGLAALLLLESEDRRGDPLACAALSLGVTFSSLSLAFLAAACVDLLLRPERLRRLYVVAVPALLYVGWWIGWGHDADTAISFSNASDAPQFVFNAASAALASLAGLVKFGQGPEAGGLEWGRPLLIVAVALAGWRIHRLGRVPLGLWVALALAGTFWVLAGLNVKPGRGPAESRYLLPGAIFVLMIAGELLRGIRVSRLAIGVAYLAGAGVIASNVLVLRDAHVAYGNTSDLIRADLGALEIARDRIAAPFFLDQRTAGTAYVPVTSSGYLSAADAYGSPADTPAELVAAPEPARVAADRVLARALGVSFEPAGRAPPPSGPPPTVAGPTGVTARTESSCVVADAPGAILHLPPGGASVQAPPQAGVAVALRRFATGSYPVEAAPLGPGQVGFARVPPDRSSQPWTLALRSRGPVRVCGVRG